MTKIEALRRLEHKEFFVVYYSSHEVTKCDKRFSKVTVNADVYHDRVEFTFPNGGLCIVPLDSLDRIVINANSIKFR